MKRYLWLMMLCFVAISTVAQTFKGRVTNEKGEPVPYAAFYLKELRWGFTTDDNGNFQTELKPGQYTCDVSSLGYTGQRFSIRVAAQDLEKNIVLAERIYSLNEVNIVKGAEDPAYAVMRKAIAYAPFYRTQIKSFTAGTYLKGSGKVKSIPAVLKLSKEIRKDSKKMLGKLFLLEEQREVTFKAPNVWENKVKAYSNTFPDEIQIRLGLATINLYEPTIFDKISPLSKGAFSYYRFKLEGYYAEGDYMINKIKVIPRKDNPKLIAGDLYIIEDLWCVSAADLSVRMHGVKATVKLTCKEVQPSVFLSTSTSMECDIDMMGLKAEATYLASVHYDRVEVNRSLKKKTVESATEAARSSSVDNSVFSSSAAAPTPHPTKKQQKLQKQIEKLTDKEDLTLREAYKLSKLMEKTIEESDTLKPGHKYERRSETGRWKLTTDSLAGKKDSLYWAAVRSVPLKPEEVQSYIQKEKLTAPKDSLRKDSAGKSTVGGEILQAFFVGDSFRTKNKKAWISCYGLPSYIPEYNFVDGFWLGVRLEAGVKLSRTTTLRFAPSLYYTTARKSLVGQGKLILNYAPRRRGQFMLSGGVLSADYNGESGESRLINAVASSFFGRNDVKLYDKRFLSASHEIELATGLLFSASIAWEQRRMLENHISRSWFKRKAEPNIPANHSFVPMPENELLKASFALEYTPAHYYRMVHGRKVYEDSSFPTFTFRYDRAFPTEAAKLSPTYHLTEFSARQHIEFGMFNSLDWYVNAGAFWHAEGMQFPDFKHFATTTLPFTERTFDTGFALLNNYAYSTDTRWAQANISWYTPYLLLKQLPFLKRKNFDEALHLRSVVAYGRKIYTELGYSVGFSELARIGVFVGFESLKYRSAGVSVSIPLSMFRE